MWKFLLLLAVSSATCKYKYETKWIRVPLDHFGFQRNETFNLRYLVNDDHWRPGGGPIFLYPGNEGQIEVFAQHTGFMWDIAADYKAKLVFAEHRYYGKSKPFGNDSLDNDHIGYLTTSQALADYADLINFLQGDSLYGRYPVIAFGGSYGGILAAYLRMKYPHLVIGAIASSAPIHMYPGMVSCEVFHKIVTSSFSTANKECVQNVRKSWDVIRTYLGAKNTSDWLQKTWNLCDPVTNATDQEMLLNFLRSMYETLAMVNYPFESDFLFSLPAHPVKFVCQYLNKSLDGEKLLEGVGEVLQTYTNYKGTKKCVNYKMSDHFGSVDASGWDYQACTEMLLPRCTTGVDDMFEPKPWNFTQYSEKCHKKYNVYPNEERARVEYGGDNIRAASNIVFSNGLLDPWAGGGILKSISNTVVAVLIVDGAHHIDLMPNNPADPPSVRLARNIHRQHIDKWLKEFKESRIKLVV